MTFQTVITAHSLDPALPAVFEGDVGLVGRTSSRISEGDTNEWSDFAVETSRPTGELEIIGANLSNVTIQIKRPVIFRDSNLYNIRITPELKRIGDSPEDQVCEQLMRLALLEAKSETQLARHSCNLEEQFSIILDCAKSAGTRLAAFLPLTRFFLMADDVLLPSTPTTHHKRQDQSVLVRLRGVWDRLLHKPEQPRDRLSVILAIERLARSEQDAWLRATALLNLSLLLPQVRKSSAQAVAITRNEQALRQRIQSAFIGDALHDPEPRIRQLAIKSCAVLAYHESLQDKLLEIYSHDPDQNVRQAAIDCLRGGCPNQVAAIEKIRCLLP